MESFYMFLPSNVKSVTNHENTLANYVTHFPHKIVLDDSYEVGLSEISYTYSWSNIKEDQRIEFALEKLTLPVEQKLPASRYESIETLVDNINKIISTFNPGREFNLPSVEYDDVQKKVIVLPGPSKHDGGQLVLPKFSPFLDHVLGLPSATEIFKISPPHLFKRPSSTKPRGTLFNVEEVKQFSDFIKEQSKPPDIKAGIHSILIYTDIVSHSYFGDSLSQILRVVPVPSKAAYGEQLTLTFDRPQYKPLLLKEFQRIEILIKDDEGEKIPFNFGRVFTTLHFRKRKYE